MIITKKNEQGSEEMNYKTVNNIFFSPSGTTKQITKRITAVMKSEIKEYDLLKMSISQQIEFSKEDVVVVGMPVFAGRIPEICLKQLNNLQGNRTFVIICVVYGNREYEDALLELQEIIENQGFIVFSAAAFVGQHSIFNQVAANRPDEDDLIEIEKFATACFEKLKNINDNNCERLKIKGNHPYRAYSNISLKPSATSKCNRCGVCAKICPANAIDINNPRKTDKDKCISCTACIAACPQKARKFSGLLYKVAGTKFKKANTIRKEPDIFI